MNQDTLIQVALQYQCGAIHPGYGFLSENAEFARKCEEHHIVFIGPKPDVIDKMGDKQSARNLMMQNHVPVVPGSKQLLTSVEEAKKIAEEIGYPVLLKASAGGGGKGMRRAYSSEELENAFLTAKAEALAQTGAVALLTEEANKGKIALFGGIKNAKFKLQVIPGDVMELNCEIISRKGPVGIGKATAYVNGKVTVMAELLFAIER